MLLNIGTIGNYLPFLESGCNPSLRSSVSLDPASQWICFRQALRAPFYAFDLKGQVPEALRLPMSIGG
jgi:hypothetical protein